MPTTTLHHSSKSLSVSMLVIGDELMNGRTHDINGHWLAKYLFEKNCHFKSMRFIRDDCDEINKALTAALNESEIVITSGGIGPTKDDKTKKILADFFHKKIIERQNVATIVTQNYNQFGRTWTPESNYYHFFPEDFIATNNPKGLAPGIVFFDPKQTKLVMAAPGVPREFSAMVEQEFFPLMTQFFPTPLRPNFQTVIRTKNIPEEKIFFELCPSLWQDLEKWGAVSSLPHSFGVDIVITYHENFLEKEKSIHQLITQSPLAPYVWQYGNRSVQEMILNLAIEKKINFSFAESCTGGLVSSKMTDLPGASEVFMGSIISYSNAAKCHLLNVNPVTLEQFGAISIQTATEMAIGARTTLNTDFAVSITGIAGPDNNSKEHVTGTVMIGYASKNKSGARSFIFPGDRIRRKERFADMALLTLLELIQDQI